MKKIFLKTMIVVSILAVAGTATVSAHGGYGRRFIDADADGVCDYYNAETYGGRHHGMYFTDANGDGICDYKGTGCGRFCTR